MKRTGFRKQSLDEIKRKQALKRTKTPRRAKKTAKTRKVSQKKKKPSIRQLKDKLWKECRRIIIQRHGNNCYTCPSSDLSGSSLHCGHFIPSSICSVEMRYSLDNLRPQCFACNIHRSGNWIAYERHLIADGIDVEALKQRNEDTKGEQYDSLWYLNKIEEYKQII